MKLPRLPAPDPRWHRCLPRLLAERLSPVVLRLDESGRRAVPAEGGGTHASVTPETVARTPLPPFLRAARHRLLVLELPKGWVLERRVVLPAAARGELERVVERELDRFTPFRQEQLLFAVDERPETPAPDRILARIRLVPRQRLEPWLRALRTAGLPLTGVRESGAPPRENLLPRALRARPPLSRRLLLWSPLLLSFLLTALLLLLPLRQAEERLAELRTRESALRTEAREALELRDAVEAGIGALERLESSWREAVDVPSLLQELARRLPAGTRLHGIRMQGKTLELRGTSPQASALIGRLEASPLFSAVRFLSPVVQRREGEQFHLGAAIRSGGAP